MQFPPLPRRPLGFLLGNVFAVLVAISFVYNKIVEDLFYPVAILIKTIPIIAIAPVLKIMLGNGIEPKVLIAAPDLFLSDTGKCGAGISGRESPTD